MAFDKGHRTNVTHGQAIGRASPEYQCWQDIKARCLKPSHKYYKYYGERGISICDQWRYDFEAFFAYVGKRPTPKHTIDRHPDNNGNYEPGNVRWATRAEQVGNRRNSRLVTLNGERIPVSSACKILGLNFKTVQGRIDRGWAPEKAITPPLWNRPDKAIQNRSKSRGR